VQDNLIAENDIKQLQKSFYENRIEFFEVKITPFMDELPDFPLDDSHENIYYGSTTFMENIYKKINPIGLFYNPYTFSIDNYMNQWEEHMLSYGGRVTTLEEFTQELHEPLSWWFIRPDADSKTFDGEVWKFERIQDWKKRLVEANKIAKKSDIKLDENTPIIASPAYNVYKEWRNYIVGGKIVSSSLYRKNFRLSKSATDIPKEMLDFVQARIDEYCPEEVFCIDVCSCKNTDTGEYDYYIIECGCMNSCGWYSSDISKIVKEVSAFVDWKVNSQL